MSDDRRGEDEFFATRPAAEGPPTPRRRESALLARSPVFAVVTAALAGWLLASLWPDVTYFFSSREPIDLGGPGAYRLEAARENRLVQIRGPFDPNTIPVLHRGDPRTVGRVAGTNLLVDRPGISGPPVYEGRLLPSAPRREYQVIAEAMRSRGTPLGDGWLVVRDGDRPRRGWLPVVGSALLLAVLAINLRALARALILAPRERR
jgi:hypothetical protein